MRPGPGPGRAQATALALRAGEPPSIEGLPIVPVRGVSAEHGRGAWDLLEELVAALPAAEGDPQAAADAG